MEKMQVIFERCKGCGLCTTVCPKQIVALQRVILLQSAPIRMHASAVQCAL